MSAATTVPPLKTLRAIVVNFAAAFGFLYVGCVKWLISFQATTFLTKGNCALNAFSAAVYCLAVGSLHWIFLRFLRLLQIVASPRACSKVTSGVTPAARAALRYWLT